MKTITPYLITKLYTWTVKDINEIFDKCFVYNHIENRLEGPSNTFAMAIAALIETWGSIMRDKFGISGEATKNTEHVLDILYKRNPGNYEIFDLKQNKIKDDIAELFRHNLVHNFGKKPKGDEFDLNIDCKGKAINQQLDNKRWHINCMKLKEDFLNLLRTELPNLLKESDDEKRW